jgi:cytochrome c6
MNKLFGWVMLLLMLIGLSWTNPAWAADINNGAKLFSINCAACHAGGKNAVNPVKTLQKADLEKYEMYDLAKVKTQITNGKAAMPAFRGRLSEQQIEDVATYVLSQADKGW